MPRRNTTMKGGENMKKIKDLPFKTRKIIGIVFHFLMIAACLYEVRSLMNEGLTPDNLDVPSATLGIVLIFFISSISELIYTITWKEPESDKQSS